MGPVTPGSYGIKVLTINVERLALLTIIWSWKSPVTGPCPVLASFQFRVTVAPDSTVPCASPRFATCKSGYALREETTSVEALLLFVSASI